jgi:hypothetical protein
MKLLFHIEKRWLHQAADNTPAAGRADRAMGRIESRAPTSHDTSTPLQAMEAGLKHGFCHAHHETSLGTL